jgi:hypothetical protein
MPTSDLRVRRCGAAARNAPGGPVAGPQGVRLASTAKLLMQSYPVPVPTTAELLIFAPALRAGGRAVS